MMERPTQKQGRTSYDFRVGKNFFFFFFKSLNVSYSEDSKKAVEHQQIIVCLKSNGTEFKFGFYQIISWIGN